MAHRFDPAAPSASVNAPPPWVVVPCVNDKLVLGPHHALLAPSILHQLRLLCDIAPQKPLARFPHFHLMVDLVLAGVLVVFLGFGLIVVSMLSQARKEGGEAKGGGVVMIGPVPIIFGSDIKWASVAIVLAIVLIVFTLLLSLV